MPDKSCFLNRTASATILVILVITALCILTAGCVSPEQAPSTANMAAPVPAADAGIRIITEDLPPFNYAGADGWATGQSTEVVNGILSRLNQTATIEILPWSEGYAAALAGPGVALYSTGRTGERENLFKWVGPVTAYDFTFYKRNGSDIELYSVEAAGKTGTIGVVREDARHQFLKQNAVTNVVTCNTDAECLRLLLDNKIDLWFGSSVNAPSVAANAGVSPLSFTKVYTVRTVPMYIAFSKDTSDRVIAEWQDALDAMKRDGTYDTIRKKYGLDTGAANAVPASPADQADLVLTHVISGTDTRLLGILHLYRILILTPDVKSQDWQKIHPLLASLENSEPNVRTWYAHTDGSYYTVSDGLTNANLKARSYFPVVLSGKESVGTFIVGYTTGKNSAVVAVPVLENGNVTGILGGSLYVDSVADSIRSEIPAPFVFYAIDNEGKMAIHSEKGQIGRDSATIDPATSFGRALALIRTQESGSAAYEDGGISYQAMYRTSPLTGWRFVVAWPDSGSAP